jgi:ribosome-associated translation inhibitor RaiA
MQVLLHAEPSAGSTHPMADHLQGVVRTALGRFGARITQVEAQLRDLNRRPQSGYEIIRCTLEARLGGETGVIVSEQAYDAQRAIDGAVRKLKRAVGTELARHDPRDPRRG